jgi:hypothetical protein
VTSDERRHNSSSNTRVTAPDDAGRAGYDAR